MKTTCRFPVSRFVANRFFAIVTATLVPVLAACAQTAGENFDSLVALARSQVEKGQYLEALETAQKAIRMNGADPQGHYYAGLALLRQGLLSQAKKEAHESFARASADQNKSVQRLLDAVESEEAIKAGDQALDEGLPNKAATALTKGWNLNPADQKAGLKAAHLWAEKLYNAPEAARILNNILANPQDDVVRKNASQLLLTIQPQLETAYREALDQGASLVREMKYQDALYPLSKAAGVCPRRADPHIYLSRVFASQGDVGLMKQEILLAVKGGMTNSDPIISRREFRRWLTDAQFRQLLEDIFGSGEADRITQVQALWIKLNEDVSNYEKAKAELESLVKYLQPYQTNEIRSAEAELGRTGHLVFEGKLSEAATIFEQATKAYSNVKANGEVAKKRADVRDELAGAKDKLATVRAKKRDLEEDRKEIVSKFLSSSEAARIRSRAAAMIQQSGDYLSGIKWQEGQVEQALNRRLKPTDRAIERLEKEEDYIANTEIPALEESLRAGGR